MSRLDRNEVLTGRSAVSDSIVAFRSGEDTSVERLAHLIDMVRELSRDQDPIRSINRYSAAMRRLYGDIGFVSISLRHAPPGHYRVMRIMHQEGVGGDRFPDLFFAGPNAPVHSGGLISEIISTEFPVVIRDLDVPDDPVFGSQLAPYRALTASPVFDSGVVSNWVLSLSTEPNAFPMHDVEARLLQANLMGGVSNSKRVAKELREATQWIQNEIDEVARIQRDLLPMVMPEIPRIQVAGYHRTFDRAGGDFYDILPMDANGDPNAARDGEWGFLIADAAGHGASAAIVIAMLSTLLHTRCATFMDSASVLSYLNVHLAEKPIHQSFVTAFFIMIDPRTLMAQFACAGHPLPLLRDIDGSVKALEHTNGLPLAIDGDTYYSNSNLQLAPGQSLLLYTDGITDAKSPLGDRFSDADLMRAFSAARGNPDDVLNQIRRTLREFEGGERQIDDQAMLLIQVV